MGRVTDTIPSFVQGMTQQPAELRNPLKGDIQKNAWPDPARGLVNRAGSRHRASLSGLTANEDLFVHKIIREGERYFLLLNGTGATVIDLDGVEYSVTASAEALAYIASVDPKADFDALTLADTTIILNRTKTPALTNDTTAAITPEAVVWVKRGNYATLYKLRITLGVGSVYEVSYTTPNGSASTDIAMLRTNNIASQLVSQLNTLGIGLTVDYTTDDSVFTIKRSSGADFDIEVIDSEGNGALGVVKNRASRFSELPPKAPTGYKAQVLGSVEEDSDDYWVEFDATRSSVTTLDTRARRGQWIETTAPGAKYKIDPETMPIRLDRVPGGPVTFTLDVIDWEDRLVGDETNVAAPSFIGKPITGIELFRNRLTFLAGGNIVASGNDDYFNFWRSTGLQVLEADPVDITAPTGQALSFHHLVPLNEVAVLIAGTAQPVLNSDGPFSAATASVVPGLAYQIDTSVKPITIGSTAYLPFTAGGFGGLRTLSLSGETRVKTSVDISADVPRFIVGSVRQLDSDPTRDTVFALDASGVVRVYKSLEIDRRLAQSAWGYWSLNSDAPVYAIAVVDGELFTFVSRGGTLSLESISLDPDDGDGAIYAVHLDQRVVVDVDDLDSEEKKEGPALVVPLPFNHTEDMRVLLASTGETLDWEPHDTDPAKIYIDGEIEDDNLIIGFPFEFLYRGGPVVVMSQTPVGGISPTQGIRVQVVAYGIKASESGPFTLRVYDPRTGSIVSSKTITPRTISGVVLNQPVDHFGRIFTLSRSEDFRLEIHSTNHTPLRIQAGWWEGHTRSDARPI